MGLRRTQHLSLCASDPDVHIANIPWVSLLFLKPPGEVSGPFWQQDYCLTPLRPRADWKDPSQPELTGTRGLGESEVSWSSPPEQEPQWGFAANTSVFLNGAHFPEWLVCVGILRHEADCGSSDDNNNIDNNSDNISDSCLIRCPL